MQGTSLPGVHYVIVFNWRVKGLSGGVHFWRFTPDFGRALNRNSIPTCHLSAFFAAALHRGLLLPETFQTALGLLDESFAPAMWVTYSLATWEWFRYRIDILVAKLGAAGIAVLILLWHESWTSSAIIPSDEILQSGTPDSGSLI